MPYPKCGPFELKRLWQDSFRRDLFARAAGRLQGLHEADELFATALLRDMAVPVLAKEFPEACQELPEADIAQQRVGVSALLPARGGEKWFECTQFVDAYNCLRAGKGPSASEIVVSVDAEFVECAPKS